MFESVEFETIVLEPVASETTTSILLVPYYLLCGENLIDEGLSFRLFLNMDAIYIKCIVKQNFHWRLVACSVAASFPPSHSI